MDEIMDLARRLGQSLRAHERYTLLRDAEKKVMADPEAMKIQEDLERHLHKLHDLEADMKPIEVDDKRELGRLQQLARSNPALQQLLKAQADYFEMMNRVNQTILRELQPGEKPGA
jgi:cell fate (sporulation/competence/biofilm development) regulator YlbF (YheA/YmcA/DUF963 family)